MDELIPLSNATLDRLPDAVGRPRYDRAGLVPGIVHIGLGNFHRAHQAWFLHTLMNTGAARDWAIVGAGVRPADAAQRDRLLAQDCLTTLIALDPAGMSAEVIGPMTEFLPIAADNAPLIARMADPAIRIVSLTVTEGGYYRDALGGFDAGHHDIAHDAANPATPRTAFGAMIAALRLRREAGQGGFTVLSCDNLQGNGHIVRNCILGLARLQDAALADWIATACSFPNAMVDCIVPATGAKELALARALGLADASPVTHERFRQWVIEDDFVAGRPPLEQVGVTFTDDVHPYEVMKLRILNAGHQLLANAGELLSLDTIAACMADGEVAGFFRAVQMREIAPQVAAVPQTSPAAYLELVERRFANPAIIDTVRRVAFDGSSRHAGFLLPMLAERLAAGLPVEGLALAEALWARMCTGIREDGTAIEPNDPNWPALHAAALAARERPEAWLEQEIYAGIGTHPALRAAFARWSDRLAREGVRACLATFSR